MRPSALKDVVKRAALDIGALAAYHRLRNRDTLTVVLFHRVLPRGTQEWQHADPDYVVSADFFAACLDFFQQHYAVVTLADVSAAMSSGPRLPPCSLLLTFDDGWRDNATVALPLLQAARVPAVVFIATDAVADPGLWWWQDLVLLGWRTWRGDLIGFLAEATGEMAADPTDRIQLLEKCAQLPPDRLEQLLVRCMERSGFQRLERQMLSPVEIGPMQACGIAIGSHAASHLPLPRLSDPAADMTKAYEALGGWGASDLSAIAFPHGRHAPQIIEAAQRVGHRILFTTDRHLNKAPRGKPATPVLGRIYIDETMMAAAGRPQLHRLATWLFRQPKI